MKGGPQVVSKLIPTNTDPIKGMLDQEIKPGDAVITFTKYYGGARVSKGVYLGSRILYIRGGRWEETRYIIEREEGKRTEVHHASNIVLANTPLADLDGVGVGS